MPEKARDSPVHRLPDWRLTLPLAQSCRQCGARTRSGASCKSPAMQNDRCRMHGGTSTGPRTSEGLERMRRANTRHGIYSEERRRLMQAVRKLVREARQTAEET
jgi:ribosomal protein L32